MRFLKDDCLAIMIDIQERLFPHIYHAETLEKNCSVLIQGLQALDIPIMISEQYTKGLLHTIESLRVLINEKPLPDKRSFSCCDDEKIMAYIRAQGKKNIILFGIEAHVCVLQTAIDLIEDGFNVLVVEDCVSSRKINDKTIAMNRMRQESVYISSYESILLELCRSSENSGFKKISQLIK